MSIPAQIAELNRKILALKTRLGQVVLTGTTNPAAHASTHYDAGSDPVDITQLDGFPGGTTTFLRADATFASAGGSYTDEQAQDAVGGMVDTTLEYVDATPLLRRAALTGDVTATAGSNSTTIANDAVTNTQAANMVEETIKGRAVGAGTGDPTDLSPDQASSILDQATDPFLRTSVAGGLGSPGGGTGQSIAKYLTGNATFTSQATPQNVTDIAFPIGANEVWVVAVFVFYDGATGGDARFTWALPSGGTALHGSVRPQINAATAGNDTTSWTAGTIAAGDRTAGAVGTGTTLGAIHYATLINGATPGTAQWQAAQSTSSGTTTTIFAGTGLLAVKVG